MGYSSLALSGFGSYSSEIPWWLVKSREGTSPDVYGQYLKKKRKQKINKPKRKKRK